MLPYEVRCSEGVSHSLFTYPRHRHSTVRIIVTPEPSPDPGYGPIMT